MKKILLSLMASTLLLSACATNTQQYNKEYTQAHQDFTMHNYRAAFQQVQAPARAGNPDAQYALGYMYYYGKGTLINENKAKYWFKHAAAKGQPAAIKALAKICKDGKC